MAVTRTLLLDSDILAYQDASKGEVRVDWDDDGNIDQIPETVEQIASRIDDAIARLIEKLRADAVIVCLSCDRQDNFRKWYFPSYKENRAGAVKPLQLAAAKEYMAREYQSYRRPNLEADDVMGVLSTAPDLVKGEKIIISIDKDMGTVPGLWFNPNKMSHPLLVGRHEADRFHLWQTLRGDPTDGYPGAPGIGPVKADALMEFFDADPKGFWRDFVVPTFESRGKDEAFALSQARCARILRNEDYDRKAKRPIPWTPT